MKNLLFVLLFTTDFCFGQQLQTPEFEFTLYVHDLSGNMDSVVIGYDSLAMDYIFGTNGLTGVYFDTAFGEIDISNQPWKNFEARVGNELYIEQSLSKVKIQNYYCKQSFGASGFQVPILVKTANSPVYVTWDSYLFTDDCRDESAFANSGLYYVYPYLYAHTDMVSAFNFTPDFNTNPNSAHHIIVNTIGGVQDTAFYFFINIADEVEVSNTKQQKQIQQQTKVFPNPTTEAFTIELPENYYSESVKVVDITGRTIYESTEKSNQINVSSADWAKGIYFYQVRLEDGIVTSGKVLKE